MHIMCGKDTSAMKATLAFNTEINSPKLNMLICYYPDRDI